MNFYACRVQTFDKVRAVITRSNSIAHNLDSRQPEPLRAKMSDRCVNALRRGENRADPTPPVA